MEDVEGIEANRHAGVRLFAGGAALPARALLEQAERGATVLAEGHDLAVDDGAGWLDQTAQLLQLGKLPSSIVAAAREEPNLTLADDSHQAKAIELELI